MAFRLRVAPQCARQCRGVERVVAQGILRAGRPRRVVGRIWADPGAALRVYRAAMARETSVRRRHVFAYTVDSAIGAGGVTAISIWARVR